MEILCLDVGSSSLKFAVYRVTTAGLVPVATGSVPATTDADRSLDRLLTDVQAETAALAVVGHRIVFGGPRLVDPTLVDDDVLDELERFTAIEPLHLRAELDLVRAVERRIPNVPQILCFDTAFHRCSPSVARRLPLPRDVDPLIQRYGFHGPSYEYVVSQLVAPGPTVIAHLGVGASLCAIRDGSPIDTTMGFGTLGGLMMATRPGDLDPSILLNLLGSGAYDLERLTDLLYRRCGLLGVSGSSSDMKTLLGQSATDPLARAAIELFVYQLVKHLGAMRYWAAYERWYLPAASAKAPCNSGSGLRRVRLLGRATGRRSQRSKRAHDLRFAEPSRRYGGTDERKSDDRPSYADAT